MFVTFEPRGGARQTWTFDAADVLQSEAEQIERWYGSGATWDDFIAGVRDGSARARKVLLCHLMRRDHPTYRFEDTPDFRMGEFKVEFSVVELAELIDKVQRMDGVPDDERAAILSRLNLEMTDALLRERGDLDAGAAGDPVLAASDGRTLPMVADVDDSLAGKA